MSLGYMVHWRDGMMYESLSLVKQRSYNNSVVRLHDGTVAEIAVIYEDEGVVKFKYRSLVGGVETMMIARMSDIKCPVICWWLSAMFLWCPLVASDTSHVMTVTLWAMIVNVSTPISNCTFYSPHWAMCCAFDHLRRGHQGCGFIGHYG